MIFSSQTLPVVLKHSWPNAPEGITSHFDNYCSYVT